MNARFQIKTLLRLMIVVVVAGIGTTLLIGPRADAADTGYGNSIADPWHDASLLEGRGDVVMHIVR